MIWCAHAHAAARNGSGGEQGPLDFLPPAHLPVRPTHTRAALNVLSAGEGQIGRRGPGKGTVRRTVVGLAKGVA